MDRLEKMFEQQAQFMQLLHEKRGFPKFPIDLSTKTGQKFVKDISYECADELAEARQCLKNSKTHRATSIDSFDRDAYIEELSDAQHYLLEIVIASGITIEEFFEKYMSKGQKNVDRINDGY